MTEVVKKKQKSKSKEYYYAVGRRKTATARVSLKIKPGDMLVNNKPIFEYFPSEAEKNIYLTPLKLVGLEEKCSLIIKVNGSGKSGQLGAVQHGIARALSLVDPQKYRPIMKRHGLLTRDQRMKERRKAGYAQSARAKKQSPKR
jgi:small subunit ribosomal protein S9